MRDPGREQALIDKLNTTNRDRCPNSGWPSCTGCLLEICTSEAARLADQPG